ncbi:twin-arginine translocation signal domain-containing protein, partial [Petrimonas sp.]
MKRENNLTRRTFLKTSAVAGAAGVIGTGTTGFLTSCSGEKKDVTVP